MADDARDQIRDLFRQLAEIYTVEDMQILVTNIQSDLARIYTHDEMGVLGFHRSGSPPGGDPVEPNAEDEVRGLLRQVAETYTVRDMQELVTEIQSDLSRKYSRDQMRVIGFHWSAGSVGIFCDPCGPYDHQNTDHWFEIVRSIPSQESYKCILDHPHLCGLDDLRRDRPLGPACVRTILGHVCKRDPITFYGDWEVYGRYLNMTDRPVTDFRLMDSRHTDLFLPIQARDPDDLHLHWAFVFIKLPYDRERRPNPITVELIDAKPGVLEPDQVYEFVKWYVMNAHPRQAQFSGLWPAEISNRPLLRGDCSPVDCGLHLIEDIVHLSSGESSDLMMRESSEIRESLLEKIVEVFKEDSRPRERAEKRGRKRKSGEA